MKRIKLTQGKYAIVDDEDYDKLNRHKWSSVNLSGIYYATHGVNKNGKWTQELMHRKIMGTPKGKITDHKDRNGLNNQKNNLRVCTQSDNLKNRRPSGVSKYLGVALANNKRNYFRKRDKKTVTYISKYWICSITVDGKRKHLGCFKNEIDAAIIYNMAARKYHGEFANPNKFN